MSRALLSLVLLIATTVAAVVTAEENPFVTGKVVAVYPREKVNDVSYIGGDVPIYDYRPVYDIAIQVDNEVSVVRWEPVTSYFPAVWSPGREVEVEPSRGSFVLKRETGEEVKVPVISRESATQWDAAPHPPPTDVLPPTPGQASYPR